MAGTDTSGAVACHGDMVPVLESVVMAAIDTDGDLVSAFGPSGPVHKDLYLDSSLLRTLIPLLALLPHRIPSPDVEGWLTLATLVSRSQQWLDLASYRCLLEECTLHLADDPLRTERPARIAQQPTRARLALILRSAV